MDKCLRCGGPLVWTLWNTEEGDASGWHCPKCDVYYPKIEEAEAPR